MILDGKQLSVKLKNELKLEVQELKKQLPLLPKLATILVGNSAASLTYINMKRKACEQIGLESVLFHMPGKTSTRELLLTIERLNLDASIAGILLQRPMPKQIDEKICFDSIAPHKDVDGCNSANFGKAAMGLPSFKAATPLGIMLLLNHYNISVAGKHALVVGRSQILGKPIASLLLNADATVTIAHSKTQNLKELLKQADLVVAAVGKAHFIKCEQLKPGVIVIDAGYNEGNLGDCSPEGLESVASHYTPVPGGVGPMTIAALLTQTVQAIKMQLV